LMYRIYVGQMTFFMKGTKVSSQKNSRVLE